MQESVVGVALLQRRLVTEHHLYRDHSVGEEWVPDSEAKVLLDVVGQVEQSSVA